jgi:nitrogen regulatory protein P-II 1
MKRIEAIIRPFKIEDVKKALHDVGVGGMTTIEVKGHGRQKGHTEVYRGSEYAVDFVPKVMLIVMVEDALLEAAVAAIAKAAKTEKIGDGKIFTSTIDDALRIRTNETGDTAL